MVNIGDFFQFYYLLPLCLDTLVLMFINKMAKLREHPSIVDIGLTLLAKASLHLKFWWEAFEFATYFLNRLPTVGLHNLSPFEVLFGHLTNYHSLKVFGCVCYPYLRPYNPHKLHFRTSPCLFLGYSPCHKGYKCFHPADSLYISPISHL